MAAEVALRTADWDHAEILLTQAEQQAQRTDDQPGLMDVLRLRAELALSRDQPPAAARLASQAADTLTHAGSSPAQRIAVLLTQAAAAIRLANYGPHRQAVPPYSPTTGPPSVSRSVTPPRPTASTTSPAGTPTPPWPSPPTPATSTAKPAP